MKRVHKSLIIFLCICCGFCLAAAVIALSNRSLKPAEVASDRLSGLDKARLAEALQLRRELGDSLWPGFGSAEIPVILWDRASSFLVGIADPPGNWQAVAGDAFSGQVYFRAPSVDPQNFAVPVGESWAASIASKSTGDAFLMQVFRDLLPPGLEEIFPYRLLIQPSEVQISGVVHESFHVFQQYQAPQRLAEAEAAHRQGNAYEAADAGMQHDWRKEIDLLLAALKAGKTRDAALQAQAFLAARQERRRAAGLSEALVDYERQLEWEEGLAKYAEVAAWRLAYENAAYQPLLTGDPDFKKYQSYPQRIKQELSQLRRQASQAGEVRFYYTGMAQALLLERLAPGWQGQAFAAGVWLEDLLAEAAQPFSVK